MAGSNNLSGNESILFADNMSFDGSQRGGAMSADGQLWIGSGTSDRPNNGGHVKLGNLTAGPGVDITNGPGTITIGLSGGGTGIDTVIPNTGINVVPTAAGEITLVTANSTVKFNGTINTLTQDFALSNLAFGSALPSVLGGNNVSVGLGSLAAVTLGDGNSVFGSSSATSLTSGDFNIIIGHTTATSLTTGTYNIIIGEQSGVSLASSESSNILIGNIGVAAESNAIRIGTSGSGSQQQDKAFVAGITGVTVVGTVTNISSTGQIGTLTALTNGQMYIGSTGASPVAGTITGTAIAVTTGAGTLSLGVTGGGLTWNNVTGATQTVFSRNGYIANRATLVTFTMNGTNIGDVARIVGRGAGGWTLLPTGSQIFYMGNQASTVTTGSLSSTNAGDCVELVALSSTEIIVMSSMGNITVA